VLFSWWGEEGGGWGLIWGRTPRGGGESGGLYGALTGCGSRPAAGRGRGGGDGRSVRDRKGSETPTGGAPTIVTGGDGLV
jgi:hypothetical protein